MGKDLCGMEIKDAAVLLEEPPASAQSIEGGVGEPRANLRLPLKARTLHTHDESTLEARAYNSALSLLRIAQHSQRLLPDYQKYRRRLSLHRISHRPSLIYAG